MDKPLGYGPGIKGSNPFGNMQDKSGAIVESVITPAFQAGDCEFNPRWHHSFLGSWCNWQHDGLQNHKSGFESLGSCYYLLLTWRNLVDAGGLEPPGISMPVRVRL